MATSKSGKKGKALKKRVPAVAHAPSDSDLTSGGEGEDVSVKDLLSNMTTMMAALHTRMDAMEDEGKKKRKVAFCGETQASRVTAPGPVLRHPPRLPAPSARQEVLEMGPMGSAPLLLPTTSRERPKATLECNLPPPQPTSCQERQVTNHTGTLPPRITFDAQGPVEWAPHLPDVSDAVCARVT